MINDSSFGIIPLKKNQGIWHVLLIKQHQDFWSFPKGHGELGENPLETAKRELFEETGLIVKELLRQEPLIEQYRFFKDDVLVQKSVSYFMGTVDGQLKLQPEEILDAKWVVLQDAESQITYNEAKAVLKEAIQVLSLI